MPRRPASVVKAEMEQLLRDATVNGWQPKCHSNPGPYQDYVVRPTKEEAEALCADCPLFPNGECREKAVAEKLQGVNGGVLYEEGRRIPFAIIDETGKRRLPKPKSEKLAA